MRTYPLHHDGAWTTIIKGYPNNSGSPCESGEERHGHDNLTFEMEGDGADLLHLVLDLRPEPDAQLLRLSELDSDAVVVLARHHVVIKLHCTNSSQNTCDPHRYGFAATAQPKALS